MPAYKKGTVGYLIKELKRDYKMTDTLVYGYWDKEFLQDMCVDEDEDYTLTDEDVISLMDSEYDWSEINYQIIAYVEEIIEEEKKLKQEQEELEATEQQLWEA